MQRRLILSSMIVFFGLMVVLAGCGSHSDVKPQPPPVRSEHPDWFSEIPSDPNYFYAHATGDSRNYQFALDTAKQQGTMDIAGQVKTKVSGMFERFREEVGMGEDAELRAFASGVSKSVVSEVVSGCSAVKQEVQTIDGGKHRAFVRMQMPVKTMKTAVMSEIKENDEMYTRFRASEGFKELESEVSGDGEPK